MSGTLVTQTIQGPSSGANANKVIIPSGHTLDASEGFTPPAGHVVNVTRWTTSAFNGSSASNSYVSVASISLTANAGNLMHVSGVFPTRGAASPNWNLTLFRLTSSVDGDFYGSGYEGKENTAGNEMISHLTIDTSWTWGGTGENTHTITLLMRAYDGNTRYYGNQSQEAYTTQPVLTFTEFAQ